MNIPILKKRTTIILLSIGFIFLFLLGGYNGRKAKLEKQKQPTTSLTIENKAPSNDKLNPVL
ncbi:MAG: hypothetical protein ACRBFS_17505 [Aureispira sp.]